MPAGVGIYFISLCGLQQNFTIRQNYFTSSKARYFKGRFTPPLGLISLLNTFYFVIYCYRVIIMKSFLRVFIAAFLIAAAVLSFASCKQNTEPETQTASDADISETEAVSDSEGDSAQAEEPATVVAQESRVYVVDSKQKNLKMRKSPSAGADEVQELPEGAEVEVEEESDGWAKVKYEDKTGWVRSDNIAEVTKSAGSTKQSGEKSSSETAKTQSTATSKESTAKTTSAKTTASKDTTAGTTSAKPTTAKSSSTGAATSKATTTKKADTSTSTVKNTTKSTTAYTGNQKPATVHIRIHGRKSGEKEITVKVNPGESYTGLMAYKAVSNKFPGESVRIEGDSIENYDPSKGVRDFYMDAYFNDAIEITATEEDD